MYKILLVIFVLFMFSSCDDCYVCEAYTRYNTMMVDFEKECGTNEEKMALEKKYKEEYPDSLDYIVVCN